MKASRPMWFVIGFLAVIAFAGIGLANKTSPKSSPLSLGDSYLREDDPTVGRSFEEYGDLDCIDFDSQERAQKFFEEEGGPEEDYHNLDRDGDGIVCETL